MLDDFNYNSNPYGDEFHVIPLHESEKHKMSQYCSCDPIRFDGILIHQYFTKPDAISELTDPSNIFLN